jgi:2-polyprenyl-3-methyl-5-hydroxy-6-metoxy-1,4-benzoquinol methylase
MKDRTVEQLLALNRAFYATVAPAFDATRGGLPVGWQQLKPWVAQQPCGDSGPLRVADVGCGNGRFAWALAEWGITSRYSGVDLDAQLLTFARAHSADLAAVQTAFVQADFTQLDWASAAGLPAGAFDLVICFAALHHVPGRALRQQVVCDLAALLQPGGTLLLSHWQFLSSARFVRKQIAWQTIGLAESDVEAGDALLPWQQGGYAVRYVHQTDLEEATQLAAAAGLVVVDHFYADGKEGNLNLYTVLRVNEDHHEHTR